MIESNIKLVRSKIEQACANCIPPRDPRAITLLAVSKRQPATRVAEAYQAGLREFGENYIQEAIEKARQLNGMHCIWHLIGPLQSNKTNAAAQLFDWFHALDRIKLATRLGAARQAAGLQSINVTIQVNLGNETSKSGIRPGDVPAFLDQISTIDGVRLRGLMCIPEPELDLPGKRRRFAELANLQRAETKRHQLDTLSMGMSDDFPQAISEGASLIRIGTSIFGARL